MEWGMLVSNYEIQFVLCAEHMSKHAPNKSAEWYLRQQPYCGRGACHLTEGLLLRKHQKDALKPSDFIVSQLLTRLWGTVCTSHESPMGVWRKGAQSWEGAEVFYLST